MWTVVEGRIVFVPRATPQRIALGHGNVPDTLTLMEHSHAK